MRLINIKNLKLEFFTPSRIPPYVILSHTWSKDNNEEVSFQDFDNLDKAKTKPGFSKIEMTCKLARESKIEYAWVDTCCIDKSSSAELSESLNSMYSWYQKSYICYAYINDWKPGFDWVDLPPLEHDDDSIHQGDDSGDWGEDSDRGDGGSSDEGYSDVEHIEDGENSFIDAIWQTDEQFIMMDNSMD